MSHNGGYDTCPRCGRLTDSIAHSCDPMPADPTVLEKIREIKGCGWSDNHRIYPEVHAVAINHADHCEKCADLLVASLSRKARDEALDEAAQMLDYAEYEMRGRERAACMVRALKGKP